MREPIRAEPDIDPVDLVKLLLVATHHTEPPTNGERIARHLKLMVRNFSHSEFGLNEKVRAFILPARRIIGVDRKLSYERRNYSILHEIGHYVLPGHIIALSEEEDMLVDEDVTLSASTIIKQEIEANRFAADCLFQLDHFDNYVEGQALVWKNIRLAADKYYASFEATARRWVERTSENCALVVFNPVSAQMDSPLTIMYVVTSELFREQYFAKLPTGQIISNDSLAYKFFHRLEYWDDPQEEFTVDIAGKSYSFPMKLYSNTYRLFGLLRPPV